MKSVVGQEGNKKIRYISWVLLVGVLLMILKFYAWSVTGSVAIFSDALESIVNIVSGIIALLSLIYASKPKDRDHPYGHGKIEFISAGIEGGMIAVAGLIMLAKGILFLSHPQELHQLTIGIVLVGFSGLINGLMGYFLVVQGKQLQSPTLYADGKHLLSDTWSSIGLIVALILVKITGLFFIDGVVTCLFGAWIGYTGFKLIKGTVGSLLDKADDRTVAQIVSILNRHRVDEWIDVHNLRVQKYGSDLHIDCHLTLPWYHSLQKTHDQVNRVSEVIAQELNQHVEVFVHSDPCLPQSCAHCSIQNCIHRQQPFKQTIIWTPENVSKNQKHSIHPLE